MHDLQKVIDLIVASSNLPISIIIIGIGECNFSKMEIISKDQIMKDSNGKSQERINV